MKKYISTGGNGDAWICYLKSRQLPERHDDLLEEIDWLHVESTNAVSPVMDYIKKQFEGTMFGRYFVFECDQNYIENYKNGKWSDRIPVSSGIDGQCPLKGNTKIVLENPFINYHYNEGAPPSRQIEYDYCIQVSAGAKDNRNWKFDPRHLKKILDSFGKRVILIGTDKKYYDEKDKNNLVGKTTDVGDALAVIRKSNAFIGLSGFFNYWASSMKIKNIFLEESPEHTERYYHKEWMKYATSIKYGSLQEILRAIKEND